MKKGIFSAVLLFAGLILSNEGLAKENATKGEGVAAKLNITSVKALVKSKMLEVQQCYTDLIIEGMAKSGSVAVTWDIDDKGTVQNLVIKDNTAKDQALGGCVTEKVQNWVFTPAEEGKTFSASYTFKFGN